MTRAEALVAGLTTYWTGKPCKHGHLADRYVQNWTCVVCHAQRCAAFLPRWRQQNPDKAKEYAEKYAEQHRASNKAWRQANKDRCAETQRAWNKANREKRNLLSQNWRQENRDTMAALKAKRRADILQRTPKWLTKADLQLIRQIYAQAKLQTKTTGIAWQVDHVIPLRGRNVSGLHVPANLQVIPEAANLKKGNRYAVG